MRDSWNSLNEAALNFQSRRMAGTPTHGYEAMREAAGGVRKKLAAGVDHGKADVRQAISKISSSPTMCAR
jgi:hypothetical protein